MKKVNNYTLAGSECKQLPVLEDSLGDGSNSKIKEVEDSVQKSMSGELNALIHNLQQPTTTVSACVNLFWGCIQLVLSLRPLTPVLWPRGGARDTNRNVQIIHEQATRVRAPDQRGVHACVVGDELNALGCIWLKTC